MLMQRLAYNTDDKNNNNNKTSNIHLTHSTEHQHVWTLTINPDCKMPSSGTA